VDHRGAVGCLAGQGSEGVADHMNIYMEYVPGGSIAGMILSFGEAPHRSCAMLAAVSASRRGRPNLVYNIYHVIYQPK